MPRIKTSSPAVGRMVAQAYREGDCSSIFEEVEIAYHGDCNSPVVVTFNGLAIDDHPNRFYRWKRNADVKVRCRKCDSCLRARARHWAARSVVEMGRAQRTWFVTLTLTPQHQFAALTAARVAATKACVDFEELGEGERFRRRCTVIGAEITKWLKRVRKVSTSRLRYVLVAEAHKSGDPHFHLLVNERFGSAPVTYRHLTDAWNWGFSSAKLVSHDEAGKAAWYTSKYLAKSARCRIRASARYGLDL